MLEQFKYIPIPPQADDDIPPQLHPAAVMMGMTIPMDEDVDMTLLPIDEELCPFDMARIVFDVATGQLSFSVKEGDRTYGAAFNAEGDLLQLQCALADLVRAASSPPWHSTRSSYASHEKRCCWCTKKKRRLLRRLF